MATMTTGTLDQSYRQDFEKVFMDNYTRRSPEYTQVFNVSRNNEDHYIREGHGWKLGAAMELSEGGAIPYESYEQGNEKTVQFTEYGLGAQVSNVLLEDDRHGVVRDAMAELGRSMNYTQDLKGWDVLNSGFNTTARSGVDDKALFASDHPLFGREQAERNQP